MLDRLIDVIIQFIGLFQIYTFVDQYEEGVVLRCGKFNRVVGPGWRWILPLNLENVIVDNVVPTTTTLPVQSLHTKDGHHVNVRGIILWKIVDIRKVTLEVEDANDAIVDASTGHIAEMITSHNWDDVRGSDIPKRIKSRIQEQAREWGIKIMRVYLPDRSKSYALRLWQWDD